MNRFSFWYLPKREPEPNTLISSSVLLPFTSLLPFTRKEAKVFCKIKKQGWSHVGKNRKII
jgi:hypothetical protein